MGVCPGRAQVLACPPEYSRPHAGHAPQDGAPRAGQRWRRTHANAIAPPHVPCLSDDRSSQQPFWALALAQGGPFLLVGQPDAHPTLYARAAFGHAHDGIAVWASRPWHGRCTDVAPSRWLHDGRLLAGKEAWSVHGWESTGRHATTGERLDHKRVSTHHRVAADKVAAVAQAGRGRWKSAHANPQGLQTTGDPVAPHVGHGQQYRAAVRLSRTLLALLCHTVLAWSDATYALRRRVRVRRQTCCDALRTCTRSIVFKSGDPLLTVMCQGLQLPSSLDTS